MNTDAFTRTALSVSEITREAKMLLEGHFDRVTVEGEISNFTAASSGHWYFSLKDSDAQVRCAMFRGANGRVKVRPSQGNSVRIRAKVSLYEGRGEFQLICEHLEPAGAGALQLALERLKKKLSEEGLFSSTAKQPVPNDAAHVGVVTSATGAALQDVLTVLARRSPYTRIYVFPVPVQGEGAAQQIAAAITQADRFTKSGALPLDVLIVGRGGGSLEDLWAFNEELVARALYAATVPTVSAVGHEIDFSIADLVADSRAATPSAAAELVSTHQNEVTQHLDMLTADLSRSMSLRLSDLSHQLSTLKKRVRHPGHALKQQQVALARLNSSLYLGTLRQLKAYRSQAEQLGSRLNAQNPKRQLSRQRDLCQQLGHQLRRHIYRCMQATRGELNHQIKLLASLGPEQTLYRGYAIVTDEQGNVVKSAESAAEGDSVRIRLRRGLLAAEVTGHPQG